MKRNNKNDKSISTRFKNWISTFREATVVEFESRIFMSWKRIIKFVGISLVPIIYGVVCVLAFWNPLSGIGNAPIAIMNNDNSIILVTSHDGKNLKMGALEDENGEILGVNADQKTMNQYLYNLQNGFDYTGENILETVNLNSSSTPINVGEKTKFQIIDVWSVIKEKLLPKTDENIKDEDYIFSTPVLGDKTALTEIHYITNSQEIEKEWQSTKYYGQLKIEKNYLANLVGYFGTLISGDDNSKIVVEPGQTPVEEWIEILEKNKMQLFTTFERNFMFGYLMDTFMSFADGIVLRSIPTLATNFLSGSLLNSLSTSGWILNESIKHENEIHSEIKYKDDKDYILTTSAIFNDNQINKKMAKYSIFGNYKNGETLQEEDYGIFANSLKGIVDLGADVIKDLLEKLLPNASVTIHNILNGIVDIIIKNQNHITSLNSIGYKMFNIGSTEFTDEENKIIDFIGQKIFKINGDELKEALLKFQKIDIRKNYTKQEFETVVDSGVLANTDLFFGATTFKEIPTLIIDKISDDITGGLSPDSIIGIEIQGKEFGLYGIGLGIFFLVIGLWVGVLMQTFVFDRGKRLAKANAKQWYLSKTAMMITTVIIQATLEIWVVYAVGWHILGFSTMCLIWLWFMAAGVMFVILIQAFWFLVKDETVGKFLVVVIMVLSLAAGGGTFPAFSQLEFFHIAGYFVPFTYVIKGFTAIVYGTTIPSGVTLDTQLEILKNFGMFFVYIVPLLTLGLLVGAKNRLREMNYGKYSGKKVVIAMEALGRDVSHFRINVSKPNAKKIKYKYDWKALPNEFDQELYMKSRELFPFEGEFKWHKNKKHDFVQKPNYSDEDQISRNE
ncbi:ABC transporter permease [Mesoplasma photuris]|uniref:ABC transporter permease n=1 Tax=Mesoplasma photuris TaxID=217731 RepID=UPI0004E1F1D2|nr:ABC transporter permease [Mesoplasma photuris]